MLKKLYITRGIGHWKIDRTFGCVFVCACGSASCAATGNWQIQCTHQKFFFIFISVLLFGVAVVCWRCASWSPAAHVKKGRAESIADCCYYNVHLFRYSENWLIFSIARTRSVCTRIPRTYSVPEPHYSHRSRPQCQSYSRSRARTHTHTCTRYIGTRNNIRPFASISVAHNPICETIL